jgi:hypothetical protein
VNAMPNSIQKSGVRIQNGANAAKSNVTTAGHDGADVFLGKGGKETGLSGFKRAERRKVSRICPRKSFITRFRAC